MNKAYLTTLLLLLSIFNKAHAIGFGKTLTAEAVITKSTPSVQALHTTSSLPKKTIVLMNIQLTREQRQLLHTAGIANTSHSNFAAQTLHRTLPRQYEVSMNGTPVLDQGMHGTCVTFATTAAIDALLEKGDYLSQLCNLALGSYFEQKGYLASGWEGTYGPAILNQILGFGVISKINQREKSCGGLKEYPRNNPYAISEPMSLDEFKQLSENLNENLAWQPLLTFMQRFQWNPFNPAQAEVLLYEVKKAIAVKSSHSHVETRLTVGTMLPAAHCSAGACASHHATNDTWALTYGIKNDEDPMLGGHEMIIIGYNDDAIAVDNEGTEHRGLLTLRNSWGDDVGDHGNYYMTYDFFKQYVVEVQRISLDKS